MKKTLLFALAAASIGAAAAPALAAPPGYPGDSIREREARIDERIDQGLRSGDLNRREAFRLHRELRRIEDLERSYRRSGDRLTGRERQDLEMRLNALSAQVFDRRHDRDPRGYRDRYDGGPRHGY